MKSRKQVSYQRWMANRRVAFIIATGQRPARLDKLSERENWIALAMMTNRDLSSYLGARS